MRFKPPYIDILRRLIVSEATKSNYIGENVSKASHMIGAARCAQMKWLDNEIVVACLFHDVGHLLAPDDTGGYGVANHAQLGAGLLCALQFSPRICDAVFHHVNAKRYIVGTDPLYVLSPASKETLKFQGGPMVCAKDRYNFKNNPAFDDAMAVRDCDDTSKIVNLDKQEVADIFDELTPIIIEVILSPRAEIYILK